MPTLSALLLTPARVPRAGAIRMEEDLAAARERALLDLQEVHEKMSRRKMIQSIAATGIASFGAGFLFDRSLAVGQSADVRVEASPIIVKPDIPADIAQGVVAADKKPDPPAIAVQKSEAPATKSVQDDDLAKRNSMDRSPSSLREPHDPPSKAPAGKANAPLIESPNTPFFSIPVLPKFGLLDFAKTDVGQSLASLSGSLAVTALAAGVYVQSELSKVDAILDDVDVDEINNKEIILEYGAPVFEAKASTIHTPWNDDGAAAGLSLFELPNVKQVEAKLTSLLHGFKDGFMAEASTTPTTRDEYEATSGLSLFELPNLKAFDDNMNHLLGGVMHSVKNAFSTKEDLHTRREQIIEELHVPATQVPNWPDLDQMTPPTWAPESMPPKVDERTVTFGTGATEPSATLDARLKKVDEILGSSVSEATPRPKSPQASLEPSSSTAESDLGDKKVNVAWSANAEPPSGDVKKANTQLATAMPTVSVSARDMSEADAKAAWLAKLDKPSWGRTPAATSLYSPPQTTPPVVYGELASVAVPAPSTPLSVAPPTAPLAVSPVVSPVAMPAASPAAPSATLIEGAASRVSEAEAKRAWLARSDAPAWGSQTSLALPPPTPPPPPPSPIPPAASSASEAEAKAAWLAKVDAPKSWGEQAQSAAAWRGVQPTPATSDWSGGRVVPAPAWIAEDTPWAAEEAATSAVLPMQVAQMKETAEVQVELQAELLAEELASKKRQLAALQAELEAEH